MSRSLKANSDQTEVPSTLTKAKQVILQLSLNPDAHMNTVDPLPNMPVWKCRLPWCPSHPAEFVLSRLFLLLATAVPLLAQVEDWKTGTEVDRLLITDESSAFWKANGESSPSSATTIRTANLNVPSGSFIASRVPATTPANQARGGIAEWGGRTVRAFIAHLDRTTVFESTAWADAYFLNPASWSPLVIGPDPENPTDSDRDGMPDSWELARFGAPRIWSHGVPRPPTSRPPSARPRRGRTPLRRRQSLSTGLKPLLPLRPRK